MSLCHAVLRGLGLPQYMLFREEKHAGVNAVHDGGQRIGQIPLADRAAQRFRGGGGAGGGVRIGIGRSAHAA